jgi:hypothetical protein
MFLYSFSVYIPNSGETQTSWISMAPPPLLTNIIGGFSGWKQAIVAMILSYRIFYTSSSDDRIL